MDTGLFTARNSLAKGVKVMMELPESYALSKQISEYLKGKIISEIKLLQTPHKFAFFKGEVNEYADMLPG